ncbi:MAG: hypothetical protein AAF388_28085, partial [Bacteroidota bacterium]
ASSGLRELKVRTVSPEIIRQNKDAIGILPDNPQNKPSFAEITGADYVVTGSYFLKGDSIVLNTRLSSAIDGVEVKTSFPQLIEHIDYKEKLVEEVRQYLLGYWVSAKDRNLPLISPPKYEAYQVYLGCFVTEFWCYQEALKIDPDFHLARVWLLYASGGWSLDSLRKATKSELDKSLLKLTTFERNIYDYSNFIYDGNYQAAFDALNANYTIDPEDYNIAHQTAYMASSLLNRTDIAIERYEKLFQKLDSYEDKIISASFYHYMDALNREGKHQKVIDFYESLSEKNKQEVDVVEVMISLYHLGRVEDVHELLEGSKSKSSEYLHAAYLYAYTFPDSPNNPFEEGLRKSLEGLSEFPEVWWRDLHIGNFRAWSLRYLAYYVLGEWDQAEEELRKLDNYDWKIYYDSFPEVTRENFIGFEQIWLTASWACLYAQQGKVTEAYQKIEEVEDLWENYKTKLHDPFSRGASSYYKARVHAILGEKEKAVAELRSSLDQGKPFIWLTVTSDLDFASLKGYPPFEELIKPKGVDE